MHEQKTNKKKKQKKKKKENVLYLFLIYIVTNNTYLDPVFKESVGLHQNSLRLLKCPTFYMKFEMMNF